MFGLKWFYSGKSGSIRQNSCIWAKLLYLGKSCSNWEKLVVFEQKLLYSGKSSSIRAKWLYLGKVVVLGKKWF